MDKTEDTWLSYRNHNQNRICRMIRSLRILGLYDEAARSLEAFMKTNVEGGKVANAKTLQLWVRIFLILEPWNILVEDVSAPSNAKCEWQEQADGHGLDQCSVAGDTISARPWLAGQLRLAGAFQGRLRDCLA
jgi:hypothetical protein